MLLRLALASALLGSGLMAAPQDSAVKEKSGDTGKSRPHVRFGGFTLNAGYSRYSGGYPYRYGYGYYPGFWGYGPYFYDPFFYGSYLHPGYFTGFGYQPSMGEVKVTADKNAWVYIDGALAGKVEKLKTMWLEAGAYDLELRDGDHKSTQRIYVLSGKTLKITPEMMEARR